MKVRMREIYLSFIDTTVEADSVEQARKIFQCIPRDHGQINDNKMFQGEEVEVVGDEEETTPLSDFDKQIITNELGYQIYEGITPQKE